LDLNVSRSIHDVLTLGYNSTGQELWAVQYGTSPNCTGPFACGQVVTYYSPIAVTPDGSKVFVTMAGAAINAGLTIVAYDATNGAQLWNNAQDEKDTKSPLVQVNPDGQEVYVTGTADFGNVTENITTVAYDTATGSQKWTTVTPGYELADSYGLAISPDGSRLFVEGVTRVYYAVLPAVSDLITLAYDTGAPPPVQLKSVVSRKVHGTAGAFDIDLPLHGGGIECRSGGANGDYQLVFRFANTLTNVSAAKVTSGAGSIISSNIDSADAHNYVVNLTGVNNAQRITVSLNNLTDSAGDSSAGIALSLGVLIADVNGSARVDAADVSAVRQQALQTLTQSNFRDDINLSGRIDAADVSIARQETLTSLP
jgi:hypothetical protein